jgi:hypothetical protein
MFGPVLPGIVGHGLGANNVVLVQYFPFGRGFAEQQGHHQENNDSNDMGERDFEPAFLHKQFLEWQQINAILD